MTQTAASPVNRVLPADAKAGGGVVHLNAFQLLMRRWSELGPYSAGQAMQITGQPDMERWQSSVEGAIRELGLGVPHFGPGKFEVRFTPVASIPIERVQGDFETFITEEINRPFQKHDLPIRFWVIDNDNGTHYFGAFYDHWIADSRAMRELMRRIFARYQSPEPPGQLSELTLHAPPVESLFRRHLGRFKVWGALRAGLGNMRRHGCAYRVNLKQPMDFTSRCLYLQLPPGLIEKVRQRARLRKVSVNDIFLAMLGRAMGDVTATDRYARKRRHGRRRDRIGLGTIVDIRDASAQSLDNVFGLYLSSYTIVLKAPERTGSDRLLKRIARTTRRIKKTFASVRAYSGMVMALFCWDTFGDANWKARMLNRHVPVSAGISNVNLTGSWMDQPAEGALDGPAVLDYIRISPTGPLIPLVFTLTTLRDQLSLCVTYRTTAFTQQQAEALVRQFQQGLEEYIQ